MIVVTAAAFSLVALPLAMVGLFRWYLVFPLVLVVAIAFGVWLREPPFEVSAPPLASAAMLAVIAGVSIVGILHPTQYMSTDRDPGIYSTTGMWIADEGSLLVDTGAEEFGDVDGLMTNSAGFYATRDDGAVYPQFAHLTGTLLGAGHMLGGAPLLVRTNVFVTAAALLVLFVLVQRLAGGWPAVVAVSAIAISLPEVVYARGPFSEASAQLLIVCGVALLSFQRRPRYAVCAVSGVLLGAVVGSRIDGVLVMAGLIGALVVMRLMDKSGPSSGWRLVTIAASATAGAAIGIVDLRLFSPGYFEDLWPQFRSAALVTVGVAVAGLVLVVVAERVVSTPRLGERGRTILARSAAGATVAVLLALWFVRPLVQEVHGRALSLVGGLQERQGLPVDPTRTYAEETFLWLEYYLGPALLLVAVVGCGLLALRIVERRDWSPVAAAAVLGFPTLVYLWRPSITPDQIFAMRRFVPTALPMVAVAAGVALAAAERAWRGLAQRRGWNRAAGSFAGAGAMVVVSAILLFPIAATTEPFWDHREHALPVHALDGFCGAIAGRPTFIPDDRLRLTMTQPIGVRCDVPVAGMKSLEPATVISLSDHWADRGEQMVVLSRDPSLASLVPGARLVDTVSYFDSRMLRTVEKAPDGLEPDQDQPLVAHVYVVDG